jgi:hypothetical protein
LTVLLAFLGIPSLHDIIKAIANGFFGALADALVPDFLKHGTVATIQHLVALPDPASWTHVGQLQGEMTYLAAMLLPVVLAVGALRYWMMGLTGTAHPAGAVGRCAAVTGVLVVYRWIVEQVVAGTNTMTHAILGFPVVGNGLARIIGVLFGGALLSGAGGVFGAFLVIGGVLFAASLFAMQVLLTVLLAVLIVAGPPLIALSAIPELSHLARTWAHAIMGIALVPLGWTVLFATAGALCLDATSFTGGAGSLPGQVAAAFAGLITFVLAVKLPLMMLGELRHLFGAASFSGNRATGQAAGSMPGAQRVRAANARLRSAAFDGVPSLGRSVGRAAGALGAPHGGPLGAAKRGIAGGARRAGILPGAAAGAAAGALARTETPRGGKARGRPRGFRARLARAGSILASAPADARAAVVARSRTTRRMPNQSTATSGSTGKSAAGVTPTPRRGRRGHAPQSAPRATPNGPRAAAPKVTSTVRRSPAVRARTATQKATPPDGPHPAGKITSTARREAVSTPRAAETAPTAPRGRQANTQGKLPEPVTPAAAPQAMTRPGRRPEPQRRPRTEGGK